MSDSREGMEGQRLGSRGERGRGCGELEQGAGSRVQKDYRGKKWVVQKVSGGT